MAKPQNSELMPVRWDLIEPHFRAGIRTLPSIGKEFGVSKQAISKHFAKLGIVRDLKPRIQAAAEELLLRAALPTPVVARPNTPEARAADNEIVGSNAQVLAAVQISHRKDIARARARVTMLMDEMDLVCDAPDVYAMVHSVLDHPDEPGMESLRNMARLVESLPARAKLLRDLLEAMRICIGLEREAFSLDTANGSDGRYTVIIRDYTGKGDPDAPVRLAERVE